MKSALPASTPRHQNELMSFTMAIWRSTTLRMT